MNAYPYLKRLAASNNLPIVAALLLLLCAVIISPISVRQPVYRLQVTFDISQSMDVADAGGSATTTSRLKFAKLAAQRLLNDLACGSHVGWTVFTGRKVITLITPVEVCQHYAGLLASLTEIQGSMRWANGSAVGKGLHQSIRAASGFNDATAVVFISDGHEAPPLETGQRGMPKTDQFDVSGVLIGVGGELPVPIPKSDEDGNFTGYWQADEVVQLPTKSTGQPGEELSNRHDEQMLSLSRLTGFDYQPLINLEDLTVAIRQTQLATEQNAPRDFRWIPAALALAFLIWRMLPWPNRKAR